MKLPSTRRVRRTGFTLIELLVVIAIIAILVGLTAAGVMKFMSVGPKTVNQSDISQLSAAVAQFKGEMHVDSIPSRIRLCTNSTTYAASPTAAAQGGPALDQAS